MNILKLHLSPIAAKWLHTNLNGDTRTKKNNQHSLLCKYIYLIIERRPAGWKKAKYDHDSELLLRIPSRIKKSAEWLRYQQGWIPPSKMTLLNDMVEGLWRYELGVHVKELTGQIIDGKKVKQIDVIRDFYQKYDISSDELAEATAIKVVQRELSNDKTLIDKLL